MFLSSHAYYSNNLYSDSQSLKGAFYDVNALRMFLSIVILTSNLTSTFSGKPWQKMIRHLYRDLIQDVV